MNNDFFLKKNLIFTEKNLYFLGPNDSINIVMDDCEDSLMKRTSELLVDEGDDLLEVGFGMGIFATYAQSRNPKSHTIIEGHPQVYENLKKWSENKKNINIVFGDWSKNIEIISSRKYDSVYFDTHCDQNIYKFFHYVKDSIKQGGKYSRFGLDPSDKNLMDKEFENYEVEIIFNENHPVNPSEHVKYFKKNTFPICVVRV